MGRKEAEKEVCQRAGRERSEAARIGAAAPLHRRQASPSPRRPCSPTNRRPGHRALAGRTLKDKSPYSQLGWPGWRLSTVPTLHASIPHHPTTFARELQPQW